MTSLRGAILAGELRPGDRLIERELCEQTGASRTAVREALRLLQGEGLVTQLPQRGCVVTVVTREEAECIYGMRTLLEGEAARLFALRAGQSQRDALGAAFEQLDAAYHTDDFDGVMTASTAFDSILFSGCGNPLLGETSRQLAARISYLRRLTVRYPGRTQQARREYRAIHTAVIAGDPQAAREAMVTHVERSMAIALTILEQTENPI